MFSTLFHRGQLTHRTQVALITLLLVACGGGGGGGNGSSNNGSGSGNGNGDGSGANPPPLAQPYGLTSAPTASLNFPSAGLPGSVQLQTVASGFNAAVFFTPIPASGGRYAVVEQAGTIKVLAADFSTVSTLLDISASVFFGGEEGLLGLAFDPNFASNGYFYVNYISYQSNGRCAQASDPQCTRIARFQLNRDNNNQFVYTTVNNSSEKVLLEISQPFGNHKGGMLAFGPQDHYLYSALGDGGGAGDPFGNAQNLNTLLGKILRIDPSGGDPYAVPANNPFVGNNNARPEIWAYGLRNPWRFSFDRQTGLLWAADVGQTDWEEIDIIAGGGNYGWNPREGKHAYNGATAPSGAIDPVWEYGHGAGQSISGGYVYRGNAMPALRGQYIYADFISGTVWALDSGNFTNQVLINSGGSISSFGEDENGELYAVDYNGSVARIVASVSSGGNMPTHLSETGLFTGLSPLQASSGVVEYDVNTPLWSDGAVKRRWIALPSDGKITFAADVAWQLPVGSVVVKNFAMALNQAQPAQLRNLETRVLIHEPGGWAGYVYRWNAQQTDADLITSGASEILNMLDANGIAFTRQYDYPSSAQCHSCHTDAAGILLGLRTSQFNRTFNYAGVIDNQLRSFNHVALFDSDIGAASQYVAAAALDNSSIGAAQRARDYLDANCAQCHRPGGPTGVQLDLRAGVGNSAMHAIDVVPSSGDLGIANARIIAAGSKERSVLWQRLQRSSAAAGRMPPLASHAIDTTAVAVIGQWIDSL
jgi:uncharacterized repeat protein (TIGR03806 family)